MRIFRIYQKPRSASGGTDYHSALGGFFSVLILCNLVVFLSCSREAPEEDKTPQQAIPPKNGREVIQRVNSRPRGKDSIQEITLRLIGPDQKEKRREMIVYQMNLPGVTKTLYSFISPMNLKGTALLIHEPSPSREGLGESRDSLWLYLPAFDRTFQIQTLYRGHHIIGTDFTYEDSKQNLSLTDYEYRILQEDTLNGFPCLILEALPTSPQVTEETGYSRSLWWVWQDIWIVVQTQYYDQKGELLKTYRAEKFEKIQGIWTPRLISMENIQTHHKTLWEVTKVQYNRGLTNRFFEKKSLREMKQTP